MHYTTSLDSTTAVLAATHEFVLQVWAYLVTFYIYSDAVWQQCTQFQSYTAQSLRAGGYQGPYSSTGRNSFTIEEYSNLTTNVYSVETNRVGE